MNARGLLEPSLGLRLLLHDLIAADVDQLLGIEGADLSGVRQALPGRRAQMQDFELCAGVCREAEGRIPAGLGRALLADWKENPDELAQGLSASRPLRLMI